MPYTQIFGFDVSLHVPNEKPEEDTGTARILFSELFEERLPAYHQLDISLGKKFFSVAGWSIDAEMGVINSYNRNNIFNFDFHTLQRVDQTPIFPYLSLKMTML